MWRDPQENAVLLSLEHLVFTQPLVQMVFISITIPGLSSSKSGFFKITELHGHGEQGFFDG